MRVVQESMGLKEAELRPLERPGFRQLVAELGAN